MGMTFLQRIIALFRTEPQETSKSGYIVVPRSVLDELPEDQQPAARRLLSHLTARARLKYPGKWFQVILRESNGKFKKHPHNEHDEPVNLFKGEDDDN